MGRSATTAEESSGLVSRNRGVHCRETNERWLSVFGSRRCTQGRPKTSEAACRRFSAAGAFIGRREIEWRTPSSSGRSAASESPPGPRSRGRVPALHRRERRADQGNQQFGRADAELRAGPRAVPRAQPVGLGMDGPRCRSPRCRAAMGPEAFRSPSRTTYPGVHGRRTVAAPDTACPDLQWGPEPMSDGNVAEFQSAPCNRTMSR